MVPGAGGPQQAEDRPLPPAATSTRPGIVGWQDAECGAYQADLALWEALCGEEDILELGCGSGRVGLHLARRGHRVTGLDCDRALLAAFRERADGLRVEVEPGDARRFQLEREFGVVLAPMQLLQLFAGPAERLASLRCIAGHLRVGGRAALAIVEDSPVAGHGPLFPDVLEIDGWICSSLPIEIRVEGGSILIRRLRQTIAPGGALLSEEMDEVWLRRLTAAALEQEGVEAGLVPVGREQIPATDAHIGSTAVVLERRS
ncbi:MAG: class I SAM-dependent methyltransferase [Solirubrobacterales bacterium]